MKNTETKLFLVKDVRSGQTLAQTRTLDFANKIKHEQVNKQWSSQENVDNVVIFELHIIGTCTVTKKVS